MARIQVFDTTLRDGEQSPGASMTSSEKLRIAHELADLGVDVLEAGFAASSEEDSNAIARIAREVREPAVTALARSTDGDIVAASAALDGAAHPRIHVFIATSDVHLEHKLRIGREECLERAAHGVEFARTVVDDVEFSAEDATRTDPDFLCRVVQAAVDAGASTINVPDTVGYATPEEMKQIVAMLRARVRGIDERTISVHCHNDLGLAVANTLAGIEAGARQVECTINGIGERAGNAALEEIVMALRVRANLLGHETGIRTERLHRTSRALAYVTGIQPQPNKAIVGRNAFAHEAGIHQHGVLSEPTTYEIMTPEMVGAAGSTLVVGKHSGRHGLEARYRDLGYQLSTEDMDRVSQAFKSLAERKKEVLDEDLLSILHHGIMDEVPETYRLVSLSVQCGGTASEARLVTTREAEEPLIGHGEGDGPIAATFSAMESLTDFEVVLEDLQIRSATPGRDAMGEVTIRARVNGQTFTGRGGATDIVSASAHAYLHVLNKAEQARKLEAQHFERTSDAWAV